MEELRGKGNKKIFFAIVSLICLFFGGFLSACVSTNDIKLSLDKEEVFIYLGETPDNTQTIIATVEGGNGVLLLDYSTNSKISVTSNFLGNGKTEIKIKANAKTARSEIKVISSENKKIVKIINVNIIQPVTGLSAKTGDKPYVVRGQQTLVDVTKLVNFLPSFTDEKDVEITISSQQQTDGEKIRIIDGNYLFVAADTNPTIKTISLQISSITRNISPLNLTYDILEPFGSDIVLTALKSNRDLIPSSQEPQQPLIYLAHNDSSHCDEIVRIEVPVTGDKTIRINPIVTNPNLAVIVSKVYARDTEFASLEVLINAGINTGDDCFLYFEISYEGYSYTFTTEDYKTQIYSYDVIQQIFVNNTLASTDTSVENPLEYNLFSNYFGKSGLEMVFDASPNTVASAYKDFYIITNDYDSTIPDEENTILLYDKTGLNKLIEDDILGDGYFKITGGEKIIIKAVSGKSVNEARITVQSKFTADFYPGSSTREVHIKFNIYEGATSLKFLGFNEGETPNYYLNSNIPTTTEEENQTIETVYFEVRPFNVYALAALITCSNSSFEIFSNPTMLADIIEEDETVGRIYSFQIKATEDYSNRVGQLRIEFGNGRWASASVETFVPFKDENLFLTAQSPNENAAVGMMEENFYLDDEKAGEFNIATKYGMSSRVDVLTGGATKFEVNYLFASYNAEQIVQNDDISLIYSDFSSIISSSDLRNFSLISSIATGKVWVRAIFSGKIIDEFSTMIEGIPMTRKIQEDIDSILRYFHVEIYIPITTFETDKDVITLYSMDSVGYYNQNLAKGSVSLVINKNTLPATHATDVNILDITADSQLGPRVSYDADSENPLKLNIIALSPDLPEKPGESGNRYDDGTIIFTLTEYNTVHRIIVKVVIIKVKMISGLRFNNVNEERGIYLDLTTDTNSFVSVSSINDDAFNKNLVYSFEPDVGSSDILTINQHTGFISLMGGQGGTGAITVAPQDRFQDIDGIPTIVNLEELKLKGIVKSIRIVVADGRTRDTSFRISNLDEIKNRYDNDFSNHYTLIQDSIVSLEWDFPTLTGGLYGKEIGAEFAFTLTNNVGVLFNSIAQNAIVADLIVMGQIEEVNSHGFIANENYGIISNVTVDTYMNLNSFESSSLSSNLTNVGGLVGQNFTTGQILNSKFFGSVSGNVNVGGIAGRNIGLISGCRVEFYTYEGDSAYGKISGNSVVGGLVGKLEQAGQINTSFVYSYHNEDCIIGIEKSGAFVGEIVNPTTIRLLQNFARTNVRNFVGNEEYQISEEENELAEYYIRNSYSFYYDTSSPSNASQYFIVNSIGTILIDAKTIFDLDVYTYYTTNSVLLSGPSATVWRIDANFNDGYPFFGDFTNETAPLSLSGINISNSNFSLVNGNNVVFFLYEKDDYITTTSFENAVIKSWNTISFNKLFNLTNSTGIRVSATLFNEEKILTSTSNSLSLLKTGVVTLTVFSKYNYTIKKDYTVFVINNISNFNVVYNGEILNDDSEISIKKGRSETLITEYETGRVAVDRIIPLKQNEKQILFEYIDGDGNRLPVGYSLDGGVPVIDETKYYIVSSSNFTHIINTNEIENYILFYVSPLINDIRLDENELEILNELLVLRFTHRFYISTFKGVENIDANVSDIQIMPDDPIVFEIELITDKVTEEGENYIVEEYLIYEIFDSNGGVLFDPYTEYFDIFTLPTLLQSEITKIEDSNFYRVIYTFQTNVSSEFLERNEFAGLELIFRFKSNLSSIHPSLESVYDDVVVNFQAQSVDRIFFTSHKFLRWDGFSENPANFGYLFSAEPNNVIQPGASALLSVNLFPNYANYQYIELTSSVAQGNSIIMQLLEVNPDSLQSTQIRYLRKTTGYEIINNGIRVYKSYANLSDKLGQLTLGTFNFYLTVPVTVLQDTIFTITARLFNSAGEPIKSNTYLIVSRPLISAEIKINGESEILIAKGQKAQIQITLETSQTLIAPTIVASGAGSQLRGVSLGVMTETIDEVRNLKIFTCDVTVSEDVEFINCVQPIFMIRASVSRVIDGVYEEVSSYVTVVVVDFLIENINLNVDSENKNILDVYMGLTEVLDFDFQTTSWADPPQTKPLLVEAVRVLFEKVAFFKQHNYFYNEEPLGSGSKYILNYNEGDSDNLIYKNFLNNLYYVNPNGTADKVLNTLTGTVLLPSNPYILFEYAGNGISSTAPSGAELRIKGNRIGSQNMKFVFSYLTPSGAKKQIEYFFTIRVSNYTDEDQPMQISTAADFLSLKGQTAPQDYILMNDIELTNYTPFDTSAIRSFDGNNKIITIRNFNLIPASAGQSSINLALFTSVLSQTTLKNVTVNYYHLSTVNIDTAVYRNINFAGFAISNSGIISNCQVIAIKTNPLLPNPSAPVGLRLNYTMGSITSNISSSLAGFVIENNFEGAITNSRVGGSTLTIATVGVLQAGVHNLSLFTLYGQGSIAGFVYSNNGNIASCFANKISIVNNTSVGMETYTAGFTITNSGKISLSYAKGNYSQITPNEIRTTGSGISTSSIGAGFVYNNSSIISDCYSNIMLKDMSATTGISGRYSAGFVYINSGIVTNAYSSSLIENSLTTQMFFSGVNEQGDLLNTGTFKNCYYYNPVDSTATYQGEDIETLYTSGVLKVDSFSDPDVFYGLSFATLNSFDGVWIMTSKGPDLVSANQIAVSSRSVVLLSDDSIIMPYREGYAYGSYKNPIIIRSAQEFNNVFGKATSTAIKYYFNIENKTVFGNYRLVNNIDLSEIESTDDDKLSSSEMRLINSAVFDGNSLIISNLELVLDSSENRKYYGMFSTVESNSIIKNLEITLSEASAQNVENVGAVAGAVENASLVNITLKSINSSQSAVIIGQNVVGGIVGLVSGDSSLVGLETTNISVVAGNYEPLILRQFYQRKISLDQIDNQQLSYAGGIVGIVDLFVLESSYYDAYSPLTVLSFSQVQSLHVYGINQIVGGTVGGVIGYSGIQTSIRDATYEMSSINGIYNQKIISYKYAAGGIIGENHGDLTQSKIEHSSADQRIIENNLTAYYSGTNQNKGNMSLFMSALNNNSPIFVGGLIGQLYSGTISNSFSRANVINTKAAFVGGLFGGIGDFVESENKIGKIMLNEIYAFGDVKASDTPIVCTNPAHAHSDSELKLSSSTYLTSNDFGYNDFDGVKGYAGGIAGFLQYFAWEKDEDGIEKNISFNGVNAVNFLNRDWTEQSDLTETIGSSTNTLKYVYDVFAMTYVKQYSQLGEGGETEYFDIYKFFTSDRVNEVKDFIPDENVTVDFIIMVNEESGDANDPKNYVLSNFTVGGVTYSPNRSGYKTVRNLVLETNEIVTVSNKIETFNSIGNPLVDDSYMNVIFRNNNWDALKWNKPSGQLLPNIQFTVSGSVIPIIVADDLKLMAKYPDKTFIIIGTGLNGSEKVLIDCSSIVDGDLDISNFRGILKGYIPPQSSEFYDEGVPKFGLKNLNVSTSLVTLASNGAVFADFILEDCGKTRESDGSGGMDSNAILASTARGVVFRNLILNDCVIGNDFSSSTPVNNMGLLAGIAENCLFEIINVTNSTSPVNLKLTLFSALEEQAFSAGVLVGFVKNERSTQFKNIKINITGSISEEKGVIVEGLDVNFGDYRDEPVIEINIGGFFGKATGEVEISQNLPQFDYLANNVKLKFNANAWQLNPDNEEELILPNSIYKLNIGSIGGSGYSVYTSDFSSGVKINCAINAGKNDDGTGAKYKDVNAGGFIGTATSLSVEGLVGISQSGNLEIYCPIKINNLSKPTQEITVVEGFNIGGVAGFVTGNSNVQFVTIGTTLPLGKSSNFVDLRGFDHEVKIGGIIGRSSHVGIANVTVTDFFNVIVIDKLNTVSEVTSTSQIAYLGGAVGFFEDSISGSDSGLFYSIINNFRFDGYFDIQDHKYIYAGGVIGSKISPITSLSPINSLKIINSFAGGVIKAERFGGTISNETVLALGGIIGSGNGNIPSDTIQGGILIDSNLAYTDIEVVETSYSVTDYLYLGGIIGEGNSRVLINSNKCLTTLYTTRKSNNFFIGAISGEEYSPSSTNNVYSSQLNLATDLFGNDSEPFSINQTYKNILSDPTVSSEASLIQNMTGTVGHKLNPNIVNTNRLSDISNPGTDPSSIIKLFQSTPSRRTYIRIEKQNYNCFTPLDLSLNSLAIVGDGAEIDVSGTLDVDDGSTQGGRLFDVINDTSFVSGVVINPAISEQKQIIYPTPYDYEIKILDDVNLISRSFYGPLSAVNEGIIYNCSVVGKTEYSTGKTGKYDKFAEIFTNQIDYVGGLVGLNKGQIGDSFTAVNLVNLTDKNEIKTAGTPPEIPHIYFNAITGGFVGLNEGDISHSYSSGVLSGLYGIVYAFSFDAKDLSAYPEATEGNPMVRNCYSIAQAHKASQTYDSENDIYAKNIIKNAYVFGNYADNSCFYDVYATGVINNLQSQQSPTDTAVQTLLESQRKITNQIATNGTTLMGQENGSTSTYYFNWVYNKDINFGYPSFGNGYGSGEHFNFMRPSTIVDGKNMIPNIGKLQTIVSGDPSIKFNYVLTNDIEITKEMGVVDNLNSTSFTQIPFAGEVASLTEANWESFAVSNIEFDGNEKTIFEIRVNSQDSFEGFFKTVTNSTIKNLFLGQGEINGTGIIGAFTGKLDGGSIIENCYNLGVNVTNRSTSTSSYAGGIVGNLIDNSFISKTHNASSVTAQNANASGIAGNATSGTITNCINFGLVYAQTVASISFGGTIVTSFNRGHVIEIDGTITPTTDFEGLSQLNNLILIGNENPSWTGGNGTSAKPFIINTGEQFIGARTKTETDSGVFDLTNNILINKKINLGNLESGYFVEETSLNGKIIGNGNLISYYGLSNNSSFVNENNATVTSLNLFLINYSSGAYSNSSIFAQTNNAKIENVNVFGSIMNASNIPSNLANDYHKVAGITISNNGTILTSNNYALIIGSSGNNGAEVTTAGARGNDGVHSNIIGGITTITNGSILNCSNYGALIGGNGGNGSNGANGAPGTQTTNGGVGGNGGHGGNASTIGGIVVAGGVVSAPTPRLEAVSSTVSGSNFGMLISGRGGNAGNGGHGGIGYNLSDFTNFASYVNEIITLWSWFDGVAIAAMASAGFSFIPGAQVVAIIGLSVLAGDLLVYNSQFDNTVKPNFDAKSATTQGGGGGAGGNGGTAYINSIIARDGEVEGLVYASEALIKTNYGGKAGNSGNGAQGGKGTVFPSNSGDGINGIYSYFKWGNGGTKGTIGFAGNSNETIKNLLNIDDFNQANCGVTGGAESLNAAGTNLSSLTAQAASLWLISGGFDAKSVQGFKNETDNNDAKYRPVGQSGETGADGQLLTITLPDLVGDSYPINTWSELYGAIMRGNPEVRKYVLQNDITFNLETDVTIPIFEGELDFNGKKITIQGNKDSFSLFENTSISAGTPTIEDLKLVFNVTGFTDKFEHYSKFISNQNYDLINIIGSSSNRFTGSISLPFYEAYYCAMHGNIPIPSGTGEGINVTWNYALNPFTVGDGISIPYVIDNFDSDDLDVIPDKWQAFVELANLGSNRKFSLITNIGIGQTSTEEYVINSFKGELVGEPTDFDLDGEDENPTISFVTSSGYQAFIDEILDDAKIEYINFYGHIPAVVETNRGLINNCERLEEISAYSYANNAVGFVITNYGEINSSINSTNLTSSQGEVAGIAYTNYGLITDCQNFGVITGGIGKNAETVGDETIGAFVGGNAAGIAIYNVVGGNTGDYSGDYELQDAPPASSQHGDNGIINCTNSGNIIAGNGGNGGALSNGGYGGSASGISVFNEIITGFENFELTYSYGGIVNCENDGNITGGNAGTASGTLPGPDELLGTEDDIVLVDGKGGNAGAIISKVGGKLWGNLVQNGVITAGEGLTDGNVYIVSWVAVTFYRNYDVDDTTIHQIKYILKDYHIFNLPTNPTKSGDEFIGWGVNRNGTGGLFDVTNTTLTENISLYAVWSSTYSIWGYMVTFDVNGGDILSTPESQYVYGNDYTNAPADPTHATETFVGWSEDTDGISGLFDFAQTIITMDTTLYAIWSDNSFVFDVVFNLNGGDSTTPSTQYIFTGHNATAPINPTKSGDFFIGWCENQNGTGELFDFETSIEENVTLYAIWGSSYENWGSQITFDVNGGDEATEPSIQYIYGQGYVQLPYDPIKTDDVFVGWSESQDGATGLFDFETLLSIGSEITLYAIWESNPSINTVAFNLNGGESSPIPLQYVFFGDYAVQPSQPSREGFSFLGWYTNINGTGEPFDFESIQITEDIALYAIWEEL